MDMPEAEPKAQPLRRHPDEHGGLSSSITLKEEGDHGFGESPVDKVNGKDVTQLDDAFLEDRRPWSALHQAAKMNPEDDGYEEFRRRLGIELTEPVPCREREKVMRTIVRVAVYAILNHCLREKLFEDCEGRVIDAPAQRHHDRVTWTSMNVNCKLRGLCAELCLESLLNTIIAIGYAMQCLCLTQEQLAQGVTLINAVQFSGDPGHILKKCPNWKMPACSVILTVWSALKVTESCLRKRLFVRNLKGLS
ncbi:uncharacterized protein LOC135980454 [Chrysemys picta bellii]|uniref:uncharacterized protein LOC135980454 n=1 Tax=Chrysemys picta bellii TaxID=8478 RepID=UPI0032B1542E